MNKTLTKIVVLTLVPCLLADPVSAAAFTNSLRLPDVWQQRAGVREELALKQALFTQEALSCISLDSARSIFKNKATWAHRQIAHTAPPMSRVSLVLLAGVIPVLINLSQHYRHKPITLSIAVTIATILLDQLTKAISMRFAPSWHDERERVKWHGPFAWTHSQHSTSFVRNFITFGALIYLINLSHSPFLNPILLSLLLGACLSNVFELTFRNGVTNWMGFRIGRWVNLMNLADVIITSFIVWFFWLRNVIQVSTPKVLSSLSGILAKKEKDFSLLKLNSSAAAPLEEDLRVRPEDPVQNAPNNPKIDPILGMIHFSENEKKIIDSGPVQRLHYVYQNGFAYLTYDGATQSRFSHSLGSMYIAGEIYDSITDLRKGDQLPSVKSLLSDREQELSYWRRVVRAAALVHDIGHPPGSHAGERAFPKGWSHERMTYTLIKSEKMRAVWKANGLYWQDVAKLAVGPDHWREWEHSKMTEWERMLSDIITSDAFGADRLDYLVRDSHFTGATYGNLGVPHLIDNLRILPIGENQQEPFQLGIRSGGQDDVYHLITARLLMFRNVYYHHNSKIFERYSERFMKDWFPAQGDITDPEVFLRLTDDEMRVAMRQKAREGDADAKAIMERQHDEAVFRADRLDWALGGDQTGEKILVALKQRFPSKRLEEASFIQEGKAPHFPIYRSETGEIVWSEDLIAPQEAVRVAYIYVAREDYQEVRSWLKDHRKEILKTSSASWLPDVQGASNSYDFWWGVTLGYEPYEWWSEWSDPFRNMAAEGPAGPLAGDLKKAADQIHKLKMQLIAFSPNMASLLAEIELVLDDQKGHVALRQDAEYYRETAKKSSLDQQSLYEYWASRLDQAAGQLESGAVDATGLGWRREATLILLRGLWAAMEKGLWAPLEKGRIEWLQQNKPALQAIIHDTAQLLTEVPPVSTVSPPAEPPANPEDDKKIMGVVQGILDFMVRDADEKKTEALFKLKEARQKMGRHNEEIPPTPLFSSAPPSAAQDQHHEVISESLRRAHMGLSQAVKRLELLRALQKAAHEEKIVSAFSERLVVILSPDTKTTKSGKTAKPKEPSKTSLVLQEDPLIRIIVRLVGAPKDLVEVELPPTPSVLTTKISELPLRQLGLIGKTAEAYLQHAANSAENSRLHPKKRRDIEATLHSILGLVQDPQYLEPLAILHSSDLLPWEAFIRLAAIHNQELFHAINRSEVINRGIESLGPGVLRQELIKVLGEVYQLPHNGSLSSSRPIQLLEKAISGGNFSLLNQPVSKRKLDEAA